jgi:hypothetical protein
MAVVPGLTTLDKVRRARREVPSRVKGAYTRIVNNINQAQEDKLDTQAQVVQISRSCKY